jgi:PadR family transcriptional regulator, regulatory protein PadR
MNDLVMLAALLRGPAYGYALKKTAGLIFGASAMHNNVVYPSLRKFMRNGWVEQSTVQGDRGQQRKQYRITNAGRKYLLEQLGTFGEREAADDGAFLFRLALFDALPKGKREAIVAARKSFLTSRAAQLSELRAVTEPRSFGAVALDRLQSLVKGELRWICEIERKLQFNEGDLECRQRLTHRAIAPQS